MLYAYLVFVALVPLATLKAPTERAVWLAYAFGLVVLPPQLYGPVTRESTFDWHIIGNALPSGLTVAAPVVASFAALTIALMRDSRKILTSRPDWVDLPILLFCAWPLAQAFLIDRPPSPQGWLASAWLAMVWGVPWVLGRIYGASEAGRLAMIESLAIALLCCLPLILLETVLGWRVHELLIGPHPFSYDGIARYFGSRPLLFFENGNQYGLYVSIAAFLMTGSIMNRKAQYRHTWQIVAAVVLPFAALASQSIGAILLCLAGGLFFILRTRPAARSGWWGWLLAGAVGLGALLYAAAVLPLRQLAEASGLAGPIKSLLSALGRQSLGWRAVQNDKVSILLHDHMWIGSGQWDWFAEAGTRPWGLWTLMIGQYGLIMIGLLACTLIAAFGGRRGKIRSGYIHRLQSTDMTLRLFQIGTMIAVADAMLNSFIFYPLSAMAGACALSRWTATSHRDAENSLSPKNPQTTA